MIYFVILRRLTSIHVNWRQFTSIDANWRQLASIDATVFFWRRQLTPINVKHYKINHVTVCGFFCKKTWTSILIYIIWKLANTYYETDPNPKRAYSWTLPLRWAKTRQHILWNSNFFGGIVFSEVDLPGKRKKNFEKIFFSSPPFIHPHSFLKTWLASKVRKCQKEALIAPGRHDSMSHPTSNFYGETP